MYASSDRMWLGMMLFRSGLPKDLAISDVSRAEKSWDRNSAMCVVWDPLVRGVARFCMDGR